ncbi:MAG TPA: ATP-binding protein [Steroidobacteraceae bacterium]|nr:ATP-binding protein [Steroidobacteraceae bacterium]
MTKTVQWVVDDVALSSVTHADSGPGDVFRDLSKVARALDIPMQNARELLLSVVKKYSDADLVGAVLFDPDGYVEARDCPQIEKFPSLHLLLQRALRSAQPLSAYAKSSDGSPCQILIAPVVAGDTSLGLLWAARRTETTASNSALDVMACLADIVGLASGSVATLYRETEHSQKASGFRSLIQSIQDYAIFTVDPAGIVTDWTEGARQVLGYAADETLGKDFAMFFTAEDVLAGEPRKELHQAAAEGRAERESWRVHRSGERIWVNAISTAVRNPHGELTGFIKVSRDLTERRRIEMEREELKAKLAAELLDMTHLHEMSMRLFETGDFSRMLEQILDATIGLQNADLGTIQMFDSRTDQLIIVAHQGFSADFLQRYRAVPRDNQSASGRAFRTSQRVIVQDVDTEGTDEAVRSAARDAGFRALQCTPILSRNGSIKGMLATHFFLPHVPSERDLRLTDLYMRLASELITRAEDEAELRIARQLAEQANQAKSRFLATASHDLRQPLQSLSLLSGTLRRMATNPYLLDAVEQQDSAIASMSGLLNALLDISKLDSGSIKPRRQNIALSEISDQLRTEFRGLAAKKGLALKVPVCDQFIYTDPTLLGQILRNLLSNALRYTKTGSVSVLAVTREPYVEIEVRDTGVGIPEAELSRIFEEFYQVDVKPNSIREGHGLGLSIVQRTAAILGHELRVDSAVGAGSVFKIIVPIGEPVERPAAPVDSGSSAISGKAPHILLIDDDPGVLKATRLLLEVEGYRVTAGRSLAEARAAAAEHPDIQLLISDYHLSGGESGDAVIRALRETLPRIEVILMTGDTSSGLRHVSPADRICVASKPIEADVLLSMMKRLLAGGA